MSRKQNMFIKLPVQTDPETYEKLLVLKEPLESLSSGALSVSDMVGTLINQVYANNLDFLQKRLWDHNLNELRCLVCQGKKSKDCFRQTWCTEKGKYVYSNTCLLCYRTRRRAQDEARRSKPGYVEEYLPVTGEKRDRMLKRCHKQALKDRNKKKMKKKVEAK